MLNALSNLLPTPLHPAVVHLPIALTVLVPVFAIGAVIAIRRGARPVRAWGITIALLALLSVSAWASLQTGEQQEDLVERIVPDAAMGTHEESAELFLSLSLAVLSVAGVGLVRGRFGAVARAGAVVGTFALVVAGYEVGHSGGALVYEHGAANAYTVPTTTATARTAENGRDR